MSYYPPPMGPPVPPVSAPGSSGRPTVVTAAAAMMIVICVFQFINFALSITVLKKVLDAASATDTTGTTSSYTKWIFVISTAVALVVVIGFLLLAMMNLRGKQWARITTFVLCGLGVLCCSCSGISSFSGMSSSTTDIYPGWYSVANGLFEIVDVLLAIGIIICLALRPATEYFKGMSGKQPYPQQPYPGF